MRRILSKEEEQKKARRNQFLIGGAMILIMFASILGYALGREKNSDSEKVTYNNYEFIKESGVWRVSAGNYVFYFKYNPKETERVTASLNNLNSYADKPLYIYSDSAEATTEIYRNLFYQNSIAERMQNACPEEEECEDSVPVKSCENNFIIIKESNTTEIKQEQNCVFISGELGNLTSMTDGFLFRISGIQ